MEKRRLAEIRARLSKATEGPWFPDDGDRDDDTEWTVEIPHAVSWKMWDYLVAKTSNVQADAEFIAHSWQDVTDLLAEIERLNDIVTRTYRAPIEPT